ncbi:MAG TPA: universal stress protein [Thermodesulfobacteriota bacterium]|nr:universal stress protein [Thermodesulfobacteriota bacterium]
MNCVLLILSTSRTSQDAIEYAVNLAKKEKAKLVVLYIVETELANEVFDKFTDIGFIGDKPSTQLTEAIMKEYRQRGYEEMGKVQIRAMEENVDFDAVTTQGDFVEKAIEVIERYKVDVAVTIKRKRSAFLKYFSKSMVDELIEKAPCEVEVFEE